MSRIFLSHSSADSGEAIAFRNWMVEQGWKDIFLDLDPERGIKAGQRWQEALKAAAERCEMVVFLLSPAWAASAWCRAEFLLAKSLSKRIFAAVVKPTAFGLIPAEMTSEWQIVDLTVGTRDYQVNVVLPSSESAPVAFASEGLRRLRMGLMEAGLDARYFAWPPANDPHRSPYPGLRPLEAEDAGIFFGREASTIVALDRLRRLRETGPAKILAILGASGAGKSSFLRAGLIPRLKRDDAHFLPLPIIRPETAVISGPTGLVRSVEEALGARGRLLNRADIRNAVNGGSSALLPVLRRLVERAPDSAGDERPEAPSLVLSIDQAEELFLPEGASEAQSFLVLLSDLVRATALNLIVLFAIRSDSFERLQIAKVFEGIRQETFALPPLPRGSYQIIIEGPAQRLADSGRPLAVEPALTESLLADIEDGGGKDALPLLAFTLERLYREYGADGDLTLDEYRRLGGIAGSIHAAVDEALKAADADPAIPKDPSRRLALLRRALIPAMATIDRQTGIPRRRVARMSEVPQEARGLINFLVQTRLLATDNVPDTGETVIEPAHEALLRQWGALQGWLKEDSAALSTLEGVREAARDWAANSRGRDWLSHRAGRLEDAERLSQREDFSRFIEPVEHDYLQACRASEDENQNRELEEARKLAEAKTKTVQRTWIGLVAAMTLASVAIWSALIARDRAARAEEARDYLTKVSETFQTLAGFVPEETEQLMRRGAAAFSTGASAAPENVQLQQVDALEEMARYFYDAWDGFRAEQFLMAAEARLKQVRSASGPEFVRLSAGLQEIEADIKADDDRNFTAAIRAYNNALEQLKTRPGDRRFQISIARLERKLATIAIAQGDYDNAQSLIDQAHLLLKDSDDSLSERASLNDLEGRKLALQDKHDESARLAQEAVDLSRQALALSTRTRQPSARLTVLLATHLQHLGDAMRRAGWNQASSAYDEAETLTLEILGTYPSQANTRYMEALIRHGADLSQVRDRPGSDRTRRRQADDDLLDGVFAAGFGRFKFGMSPAEVSGLFDVSFAPTPWPSLPRANEYKTGEVRYLWKPIHDVMDFQDLFQDRPECLDQEGDYVTFLFHEEALIRISFRLWGTQKPGCRDRQNFFAELAQRYHKPLSGLPNQRQIHWETTRSSLAGGTVATGPILDILAR